MQPLCCTPCGRRLATWRRTSSSTSARWTPSWRDTLCRWGDVQTGKKFWVGKHVTAAGQHACVRNTLKAAHELSVVIWGSLLGNVNVKENIDNTTISVNEHWGNIQSSSTIDVSESFWLVVQLGFAFCLCLHGAISPTLLAYLSCGQNFWLHLTILKYCQGTLSLDVAILKLLNMEQFKVHFSCYRDGVWWYFGQ